MIWEPGSVGFSEPFIHLVWIGIMNIKTGHKNSETKLNSHTRPKMAQRGRMNIARIGGMK